ncbi:MAG TPA: SCO family protein [Pyrinomonadaceae bacterium]|nr:SCO family protein [Pyrinomonadaceae bacterium]
MRYLYLFLLAAVLFTSCQKSESTASNSANAKRYDFKGKVVSVDKIAKTAKIDHQDVPGLMPAMTMDFPIHENWVWDDLVPGVEIRAELVEDKSAKDPYWLEKIAIVANSAPNLPPAEEKIPVQIGKSVPDFSLTDQDGKKFSFKDYRGKALAVTFIYRECPLPEFCIKMSKQFSDMAKQIAADPEAKDQVRLLSISFDPERDTPEKLKQYGLGYLGKDAKEDFTIWRLAVGTDKEVRSVADFFGMQYETDANDKTQINHSLVTAIIAPDGKVTKIFAVGRWTPDDVLSELKAVISAK